MTATALTPQPRPGFFAPIPETPREDLLKDYLAFLERRNGSVATEGAYPVREAWLAAADGATVRHAGSIDADAFERRFAQHDPRDRDPVLSAVLAFVKVNAGEAYGVEVVSRRRHGRPVNGVFDQVERVLGNEETYHTKILLGATYQFGLAPPKSAWHPALSLRLLIGTLAWSPKVLFHPVLLASEASGVFTFAWMLKRVGTLFADQPALRDALEARLIEILVDEIGHVAFNRLAVGPLGMSAARSLSLRVAQSQSLMTPEFVPLGWDRAALDEFAKFDYASLPEEARRRAFFV